MPRVIGHSDTESAFLEVLTTQAGGRVFGHRLVGASPGPQAVAAGTCSAAEEVFDRLLSIPTLRWMRGTLVLIRLDALDDPVGELSVLPPIGHVDRTLMLPWPDADTPEDLLVRRSYHMVLRLCAKLGMIAGRGVAR